VVRKPEGKNSLMRPNHRLEDNIKMYLTEIRYSLDVTAIEQGHLQLA
jgi:hypothetical protein